MPTACCPSGSSAAPASGGFTGIYKMKNGEALVQETNGRIKFSINAAYGQNVGEVAGEVPLTGDTANDVDRDGDCMLSFKPAAGKLDLAQDGTCGMGLNVSGSGTYKRVSTRRQARRMRLLRGCHYWHVLVGPAWAVPGA